MADAKFTPGPWTAVRVASGDYRIQYNTRGNWLGLIYQDDENPDRVKADADVAAAAPELYEALELLVDYAEGSEDPELFEEEHLRLNKARAALAKARGETHA